MTFQNFRNRYRSFHVLKAHLIIYFQESVAELIGENVISSEKYNELQKKHLKVKSDYQKVLDIKLALEIRFMEMTKVSQIEITVNLCTIESKS